MIDPFDLHQIVGGEILYPRILPSSLAKWVVNWGPWSEMTLLNKLNWVQSFFFFEDESSNSLCSDSLLCGGENYPF